MSRSQQEDDKTVIRAFGWAAMDSSGILSPFHFTRRINGDHDVTIRILYCGICATDLQMTRNHHGISMYPMVPGHEIVGIVSQVGNKVTKFKPGHKAAVGCLVSSCLNCHNCHKDLENYCPKPVHTYTLFKSENSKNYGGFSDILVVDERFAIQFPDTLSLSGGAPLLCAGITVYSPMKYYGLYKPEQHLGVVGLGGLGHLAVKFAKAFGMKVTVISTSINKRDEAVNRLGADSFVVSHDIEQMEATKGTLDGIIDTVPAPHDINRLINLLNLDGKLILLTVPDLEKSVELSILPLLHGRKMVGGSVTGGMKETQEMINFAADHNIVSDVEIVSMKYVNTAMDRLAAGDVRYRFVIDIAATLTD
ncbi:8-hydroxygeraniol dehydrogenase-like [Impatiens glandulifera]|uniref:8-hydroxygeraniol dehydrogenase-like n=1 Tax=Impatiens glandulifera TaxID=253017 RepID=UPI001FB0A30E|nr:8-hydroxygeraniol dehydrogenase-like [Impatiens glandulifera]